MRQLALLVLGLAFASLVTSSCSKDPVDPGEPPQMLAWKRVASGTDKSLWSATGTASNKVFALGDDGTIRRFNGVGWTDDSGGGLCDFVDAWTSPSGHSYAVGGGKCFLEYDGTSWSDVDPLPRGSWNYTAIWGISDDDIFVAATPVAGTFSGRILRWDGTSWSITDTFEPTGFGDLWGSSSSDVFAVGSSTIIRFDGIDWSDPMTIGTTKPLWGLWGFAPDIVYAFGDGGAILRYDGADWAVQTSGVTTSLFAGWGTSPNNIFAVGFEGVVLHYNGTAWSPMESDTDSDLFDVWGSSGNNIFAVGISGRIIRYAPE